MDQVLRLRMLLEAHPYVEVTHFRFPLWHFRAVWYDAGIRREICAGDLIDLVLDALRAVVSFCPHMWPPGCRR